MYGDFLRTRLSDGVNLYVGEDKKFKSVSVRLFLQRRLEPVRVSENALIPRVLKRGTQNYKDMRQLARRLEELYGARLLADVAKVGDRQVLVFGINMVAGQFVGEGNRLLRDGLDLLNEVVTLPATRDGGFVPEYVDQEKEVLKRQIRSLLNDKTQYSMICCVKEMFRGEPFGIHHLGNIEEVEGIEAQSLYGRYRRLLEETPVDIFVVGDMEPASVLDSTAEEIKLPAGDKIYVHSQRAEPTGGHPRRVEEHQPVKQGKLTMGYRTGTTLADDSVFAMIMFDGILGAFPHSKLFLNVRERQSLAYYAQSLLDTSKGVMLVIAGIDPQNYERAVEIIERQVNLMREGKFSDDEVDATRKSLMHRILASEDSPSARISIFYEYALAQRPRSARERLEMISKVTRDDIIEAARKVALDTIYFVGPERGGAG